MTMSDSEYNVQVVLTLVEPAIYLVLAGWCLSRLREGWWALAGAIGAALVALALGVYASVAAEGKFFETSHIADELISIAHSDTALTAARVVGALLLVAAVVQSRRTPPDPPSLFSSD